MHSANKNIITHDKIIDAMTKLGYENVKEGVCNGLAQMWAQAIFCQETDRFLARLQLICQTADLPLNIAAAKDKRGKGLTEEDHTYLDIMAFFDGVQLYQNFRLYTHLLEFNPHHLNAAAISALTLPLKLEKKSIIEIDSENSLANTTGLQSYLNKLASEFTNYTRNCNALGKVGQRPPEPVITIHSCTHKIALRYKHTSASWELADANQYPPFNLSLETAAQTILQSLTEGPITPINISIFTTEDNPLKGTLQIALEKTKMATPINRLTARSLSSKRNHLLTLSAMRGDEKKFTEIANKIPNSNLWEYMIPAARSALFHNQTDIINIILKQYPDCLMLADEAQTYLNMTIVNRQHKLITYLLTRGANVDEIYNHQRPLHIAISTDDLTAVVTLITHGANVNLPNQNDETPLFYAIKLHRIAIIHYLLSLPNLSLTLTNSAGDTALMVAIRENSSTACELLLAHKTDLNTKNLAGETPAILACTLGHQTCLSLLINHGADLTLANQSGITPLLIVIMKQHWDMAAMILIKLTSLDSFNSYSYSYTINQLCNFLHHIAKQIHELRDDEKQKFRSDIKHHRNALGLMLMKKPKIEFCRFFSPNEKQRKSHKQYILSACETTHKKPQTRYARI